MRLAVISDIHGNIAALEAVLADIRGRSVDSIIHLGDLVGYCTHPDEVVARIREEGIDGVIGNYDLAVCHPDADEGVAKYLKPGIADKRKQVYYWTRENTSAETKKFLLKNPAGIYVEEGDRTFLFTHGSPERVNEYLLPETPDERLLKLFDKSGADVLVVGHTHMPMAREAGGKLLLNPGSVGKPKDGDARASYMIIDTEKGFEALHIRVTFDVESVARDCVLSGLPL